MHRRDALVALGLGVASAVTAALTRTVQVEMVGDQKPMWMYLVFSALLAVPLAWRRRWPIPVMLATSAIYIVGGQIGAVEVTVSQVMLFLAFYSVGAWCADRRRATLSRLVVVIAMGTWLLVSAVQGFSTPETGEFGVQAYFSWLAVQLVINAGYFGGAWVFGDRSWQQALEREALERAQAEVRAQQAQLTEQAIALERLRIARELHDVVAHHVSAMGIQAGAARRLLVRDPDRAAVALRSVEESAREAIAELGTMVGALRSKDEGDAPMPTLADLGDLIRAAGDIATITQEMVGEPRPLSPAVELTLYRVAQESLTNVRKHAGAGANADIRLRYLAEAVEIEISDDGGGARASARPPGSVLGQRGMRERVAAVGGTLELGPQAARRLPRPRAHPRAEGAGRGSPHSHRAADQRRGGTMTRILLVDDQALVRAGFRIILETGGRHRGGRRGGRRRAAPSSSAERLRPDVVCMDVQMPAMDGLEATRRIVARTRAARAVLILTTFDRDDYLFAALEAGASGFLLKNA